MPIDGPTSNAAALERQRQEQARRQREEQIKAQQRAAQQREAQQAAAAKQKQDAAVPDKKEGFFAELKENVVEATMGKLAPAEAKQAREQLATDLAKAETPEQLTELKKRSATLATRADVSDDPAVQAQVADVRALDEKIAKAEAAQAKVAQVQADLASADPAVAANARAALLSRPKELQDAVKALGPLKDGPLGKELRKATEKIAKEATPAKLAEQLTADPDLSHYPPEMGQNLLAMRALQDPQLDAAMDGVAKRLLADATDGEGENPLSYDAIQQNPDLMRLVAPLQNGGGDCTTDAQMKQLIDGWGKAALDKSLDGAKGKDEVEDALKDYQDRMLDLAGMGVDPTAVAQATADVLEANKKTIEKHADDGGGPLGFLKDAAGWVKDRVGDLVGFVKDKVEDVAKAGAKLFYDKVIDPALDSSPLGEDTDTFKAEQTGILGDLVTNRLEVGESAFIRLDASAAIGGVKLGGGAQMEIKRVPKLDANGEALPPVNGVPQTELQVKVLCDANAGLGLEAQFGKAMGKQTDVKGNEAMLGASAGGGAEVEAGVRLQTELTFSFDATDPQAIQDMTGLFKETAETGLKAAIPGIGPVLAAANAPDQAQAIATFAGHLETVRVEAGAYANASVSASVTAGNVEEQKNAVYKAGEEPEDPVEPVAEGPMTKEQFEAEEKAKTLKGKATKLAAGEALNNAGLDLGSFEAAMGGDVSAGIERNFKTGETTIYLQAKAEAKVDGSVVGGLSKGAGADYNRKIAVTLGPDGKVKELSSSEDFTKEQFEGLGRTDIKGRVDSEVLAQVSTESTITVKRTYSDLDDFKGKNPAQIAQKLLADSHSNDNPKLVVSDIKASETSQMELGQEFAGIGIKLTLGRTQEQDVEQARWNETMKSVGR